MSNDHQELVWISLRLAPGGEDSPGLLDEPFPPRDGTDLEPLVRSIARGGVLCPILVRKLASGYQVVCGWRRLQAARKAGLARIPALVKDLDDAEAIQCYYEESSATHQEPAGVRSSELTEMNPRLSSRRPQDPPPGDDALERVLVRARAFFEEVRVSRIINVPRTEILVDSIVETAAGNGALAVQGFVRPALGDLTPPHSVLVTQLCARLARHLAWDDAMARTFVLGGFLHDVGMVFVSDTASRGLEALTPAELRTIQSHTRIGCALIAGTGEEWSLEASLMARDHHERWNGSGYPDGKTQTEVGYASRVLGLLDAYAALVTPRPHRQALSPQYAQETLCQALQRGLWDPTLLPVLTEALPRWPVALEPMEALTPAQLLTRNSVELRGDLVTMLAEGST